jgi:hypothetical protein
MRSLNTGVSTKSMNLDMPELLNKISMEHQSSTTYSLQFVSFIKKWMYAEDREDKEIERPPV